MAAAAVVVAAALQYLLAAHQPMRALVAQVRQQLQALELPRLAAAVAGLPLALALAAKFVSGSIAKGLTNVSVRS
jgi:fatty acid desaturase